MSEKDRTIELLSYLKEGGYTIRDLIDAFIFIGEIPSYIPKETLIKLERTSKKEVPLNVRIHDILTDLELTPNLKGYHCTKLAISLLYEKPNLLITKDVYPIVSKKLGSTPVAVERTIRQAVSLIFKTSDSEKLEKYFGSRYLKSGHIPKNKEFLATIAQYLKVEYELS